MKLYLLIGLTIALLVPTLLTESVAAQTSTSQTGEQPPEPMSAGGSRKKKKKRSKKMKRKKSPSKKRKSRVTKKGFKKILKKSADAAEDSLFSIQIEGGYESPYGNGFSLHLTSLKYFDLHAGAGYNTSGVRVGVGAGVLIFFTDSFGLTGGASAGVSTGNTGTVELTAKFTSEASGKETSMVASKEYDVTSARIASGYAGLFFNLTPGIGIFLNGSYTQIIGGNEVTLKEGIKYDQNVEISNEDDFTTEFDRKALEKAQTGGPGATLALRIAL